MRSRKLNESTDGVKYEMSVEQELKHLAEMVKAFEALDESARQRAMVYFINRFQKYVPSPNY